MADMILKIMVEVLTILAIATKEVKHGRFSELLSCIPPSFLTGCLEKYFKKLMGNREIEGSLERLDKLTQEEARMASVEQLRITHSVDNRVRVVGGQVQDVRNDVQDVRVDMQGARGDLRDVGNMVRGVGDKLDQANRSSSL